MDGRCRAGRRFRGFGFARTNHPGALTPPRPLQRVRRSVGGSRRVQNPVLTNDSNHPPRLHPVQRGRWAKKAHLVRNGGMQHARSSGGRRASRGSSLTRRLALPFFCSLLDGVMYVHHHPQQGRSKTSWTRRKTKTRFPATRTRTRGAATVTTTTTTTTMRTGRLRRLRTTACSAATWTRETMTSGRCASRRLGTYDRLSHACEL